MKRHFAIFVAVLSSVLTFSACDSSSIHTGRFVDGPVEGLRYSTATRSGYTNASGEFTY
jgi:hypothetical protein